MLEPQLLERAGASSEGEATLAIGVQADEIVSGETPGIA
jgi:hypothetical protein